MSVPWPLPSVSRPPSPLWPSSGDPGALTEPPSPPSPPPMGALDAHRRRPGILVMVNDVDWELSGREETELEAGDTVVFLSTLHGG